jgi:type II secretory pathway component PulM
MSQVQELHRQAMDLAEQADLTNLRGDVAQAKEILQQALDLEAEAAGMVADDLSAEPTRSVLHRSAATLAIECSELQQAEKLIAVALAGSPPSVLEAELKDLLMQINLHHGSGQEEECASQVVD